MSPRRTPKHSPEQEALDLGIFGAEPVAPVEPTDPVVPAEKAEPAALAGCPSSATNSYAPRPS